MISLKKLWNRIYDDIAVYLATLVGVVSSMAWPMILEMALHGAMPKLTPVDLVRVVGASIVAVALAVRSDQEGAKEMRNTPAALRRRVKAAFSRGFGWQAAIGAITAVATGGGA